MVLCLPSVPVVLVGALVGLPIVRLPAGRGHGGADLYLQTHCRKPNLTGIHRSPISAGPQRLPMPLFDGSMAQPFRRTMNKSERMYSYIHGPMSDTGRDEVPVLKEPLV